MKKTGWVFRVLWVGQTFFTSCKITLPSWDSFAMKTWRENGRQTCSQCRLLLARKAHKSKTSSVGFTLCSFPVIIINYEMTASFGEIKRHRSFRSFLLGADKTASAPVMCGTSPWTSWILQVIITSWGYIKGGGMKGKEWKFNAMSIVGRVPWWILSSGSLKTLVDLRNDHWAGRQTGSYLAIHLVTGSSWYHHVICME